jgi:hypothetical protein
MATETFGRSPYYGWEILSIDEALAKIGIESHLVNGLSDLTRQHNRLYYKEGERIHKPTESQLRRRWAFPIRGSEFKFVVVQRKEEGASGYEFCIGT